MKPEVAISLIKKGIAHESASQRWIDLGSGDGVFTQALGSLLPDGSSIKAFDQNTTALKSISWNFPAVELIREIGNFTLDDWGTGYDGILMANSLHYVSRSKGFIQKLKEKLNPRGRVVIVEYERRSANAWVPYPINFELLKATGEKVGFKSIVKMHEVPSAFDDAKIYSAVLTC